MAVPPETTEAPPPPEYREGTTKDGVEVCLFDESADGFSRAVRAISELADLEPEPDFTEAEVERLASSITFLREWRHFSYEPKDVSFNNGIESTSSRDDMHSITLTQFSSVSVPQYLAVAAHPPGSSYHKIGMPLTGRGIIQVWCLLAPFEDAHSRRPLDACNSISRRGRPRKIPDGTNSVGCSSNPPKPRGRPRKRPCNDQMEPVPKRPRGRPRKYPLPIGKLEDSSQNSGCQDIVLFDPLATSTGIPDDLPLAYALPTMNPVESTPKRGRGRPRKIPSDKLTGSSGAVSKDECTEPSPTTATCAKPKRPRGRPRKYPVPINDKSASGADVDLGEETTCQPLTGPSGAVSKEDVCREPSPTTAICAKPKRQCGRPRKYPVPINYKSVSGADVDLGQETVCTEFNANLSIVAVDAALPIVQKVTSSPATVVKESACIEPSPNTATRKQPKRTRVRPQKYSDTDIELGKHTTGQPVSSECSLDHTACTESNLSIVAVDSASLFTSSTTATCQKSKGDSLQPIKISPKSRESSGRKGRGRPKKSLLSVGTSCLVASDANFPVTTSVLPSDNNLTSLVKSDGEFIASNLGSIGSSGLGVEKSGVHAGVVPSDAASPGHGLYNANFKEESSTKRGSGSRKKLVSTVHSHFTDFSGKEQKTKTTQKSSDPVILVENCMNGPCPRKGGGQPQRIPASNESTSTSVGDETHTMERFLTPMTTGPPRSEDMADEAGLIQANNGIVNCEGMKLNERIAANVTSHCNENAQTNQVAPNFKNSDRLIDEVEATELVPLKEPREDVNMFCSVENSNSSPIPKDIALPRLVLCLAHNGKVAWDIKWKPPVVSQPEQKSRLGFLAVLLGNGSLEVWEVPSPCMIQKIYSPSKVEGSDPRFLKLQPVFRCVKVKCGNRQSIPLTVDWSPSPPHDMILAGCHDGTVALWNFSMNLSSQDSKPFMCVIAESVPIRALSWAPYISDENINTFVTAGADGLKFWDLRDPYRPLWELTTAPRAVLSLQWLKDGRGIVISMEDGTLKFLSLPRIANDVPATGRPFVGTKNQGVATYQLSEYLIWSVHASDTTGCAALLWGRWYCCVLPAYSEVLGEGTWAEPCSLFPLWIIIRGWRKY
uniref:Transducin/WD40 repeat-like superfamily protein n=1 Tax=Setaria italica TaxID=4555 RepID=K3XE03_SETIT